MSTQLHSASPPQPQVMYDRKGNIYEPVVGPRLRVVLFVIFVLFAILGANSVYLVSLKVLNWLREAEYRNWFHPYMFGAHLALGLILIPIFVIFVGLHLRKALGRPNRPAVRLGLGLLVSSAVLLVTGVLMMFMREALSTRTLSGQAVYWLHALCPLAVIAFYIAHRLAGPSIRWRYSGVWGAAVALIVIGFGYMHLQDPRKWGTKGAGEDYFFPSSARTSSTEGETPFLSAEALMSNDLCLRCHQDAYAGWFHSAHHFSSFNNLPYRQSILDMRKSLEERAKEIAKRDHITDPGEFQKIRSRTLQATRWCAGCHDPVPFFSGAFDDDEFFKDLEVNFPLENQTYDKKPFDDPSVHKRPTAHAGLTCVSCHGITHINSITGNGDYTIEEPIQYPFAYSKNPLLQKVHDYLVKASPDQHKRTFMKPFMRTSEFCSVCHKVSLPQPVNDYKWTRGQNHYDSHQNSGASGFGSRSFYHPPLAKKCSDCHMPLIESKDFGNIDGKIHNHLVLGANTGLPALRKHFGERNYYPPIGDEDDVIRHHQEFLRDKRLRIDLFGLRDGGTVYGELRHIRPELPELEPGKTYLLEVVVRNLGVGHEFTQGTIDSNEVWVQLEAGQLATGKMDSHGYVDPWSHFLNAVVLDRRGNRIDRRNAKDIFVPLFSHQIPPSSSQVVHYRLEVPKDQRGPLSIKVRVNYRKFDRVYQDFFMNRLRGPQAGTLYGINPLGGLSELFGSLAGANVHETNRGPQLPITVLTEDTVTLPIRVAGVESSKPRSDQPAPADLWERYNDYGIGLLLQGQEGAEKGLLKQAEAAFREVARLKPDYPDAYINLSRAYQKEGRLADMAEVLKQAEIIRPNYWKTAWQRGLLNKELGYLDDAITDFRSVLKTKIPESGFDFSKDREIRRELARAIYDKSKGNDDEERVALLQEAIREMKEVLAIDPEDRDAHYTLHQLFQQLGDQSAVEWHRSEYRKYQIDDNARDFAVQTFRRHHPWADRAAQATVIYELKPVTPERR